MKKIQFLVFSLVVILSVSPSFANRGSGKPENCSVGIWAEDGSGLKTQKMTFTYDVNQMVYYSLVNFQEDFAPARTVGLEVVPNTYKNFGFYLVEPEAGLVIDFRT